MEKTKVCKHCQSEIPKKAKVCPQCRKKQGGIGKWIVVAIFIFALVASTAGSDNDTDKNTGGNQSTVNSNNSENQTTGNENNSETENEITYTAYTVDEMVSMLEENALKAEKTYQDQYIELTGKLSTIDSDGSYIALSCIDNEWSFTTVQCKIQNDTQLDQVLEMKTGDTVTVRGKITAVGELLGYSLDMDSIN